MYLCLEESELFEAVIELKLQGKKVILISSSFAWRRLDKSIAASPKARQIPQSSPDGSRQTNHVAP